MCDVLIFAVSVFHEVTRRHVSRIVSKQSPNPAVYYDVHKLKLSFKKNKNYITFPLSIMTN